MSKQTGIPLEETRKKIWMVDSKGLIVKSRMEMLQHFKRPWAHDHEPVQELVNAVKSIKPTVLIGSSGAGRGPGVSPFPGNQGPQGPEFVLHQ